jgi:hypothetical protein
MSKLPQLNLRIPEQHHQMIRDIAQLLRERNGDSFAASLADWLGGRPASDYGSTDNVAVAVGELAARVAELEQWRQGFSDPEPLRDTAPAQPAEPLKAGSAIPEEVLMEAHQRRVDGQTWKFIRDSLELPQDPNSLRQAVERWRKRNGLAIR